MPPSAVAVCRPSAAVVRLRILSGGLGPNAVINNGGQQTISAGGFDENSTINSGGRQHVYGEARGAKLLGGSQIIYNGGLGSGGTMADNASIDVRAGGSLSNTVISGGGNQITVNGGTLDGLSITAGSGNLISVNAASLKGMLQDQTASNSLSISNTRFITESSGTGGSVGLISWKKISLSNQAGMTLAGDLPMAANNSELLINGTAYLNQSIANATLRTSQFTNAGTLSIQAGQTLNLIGNYTQTGSGILQIGINQAGNAGTFKITGNATLQAGARLILQPNSPDLVANTRYSNLMSASQGISGSFSNGIYRGRRFKLESNSTGGIDLIALNRAELNVLLGGGEAQASLEQSQVSLNILRERITSLQRSVYDGNANNSQIWISPGPYGHVGRRSQQGSLPNSGYEQKGGGIALGAETLLNASQRIGVAAILGNSQIDGLNRDLNDQINSTSLELALYGQQQLQDNLNLSVIAKSGYGRAHASRIETSELPVKARSSQNLWSFNLAAELSRDIQREQLTISPLLGLEYGSAWVEGYKERGAGYYNLDVDRQQAESLIASLGGRVSYQLSERSRLLGLASVGYDALASSQRLTAETEDTRFSVRSVQPGKTVSRVGLAYEWLTPGSVTLRAGYDYLGRSQGYQDHMLRLDWVWLY